VRWHFAGIAAKVSREECSAMNRTSLVALTLTVLSPLLFSRQLKAQQVSKADIEIGGTRLRLGMTKADVAEKLTGVPITKDKEDFWLIGAEKSISQSLQFTNGRLSYASRYWPTFDNDILEAFYGAVTHLNNEGFSTCKVNADSKLEPDEKLQRVWIRCGEKTILLARNSFGGKTYNTVDEMLGNVR
jgi:hypothetical protein